MPAQAYVSYEHLMPQGKQFDLQQVFRMIVYMLRDRRAMAPGGVCFDFYRLAGGPYGYALPATITLQMEMTCDGAEIVGRTIYSGFPSIQFSLPLDGMEKLCRGYLSMADFEAVYYLDPTGFKQLVARKDQLKCSRL